MKFDIVYEIKPEAVRQAERLLEEFPAPAKILIFPHVRADGDSYGSGLALALALRDLGYQPLLYLEEEPEGPNRFFDLASLKRVFDPADPLPDFAREAAAAWMIDCSELGRLGRRVEAWKAIPHHFVTDHHLSEWETGDRVWIDRHEPATASMIHDLIAVWERRTGRELFRQEPAEALFAALLTDTGRFTYANVCERTFLQAARLKAYGVDQEVLVERFFERMRYPRLAAYGELVRTMEFPADGRVALAYLSEDFRRATSAEDADYDGLVSWMRRLEGVELSVLLTQQDGVWRGSCRSSLKADARGLARSFGGGGHLQAAGFTYGTGTLPELLTTLRERVGDYLR